MSCDGSSIRESQRRKPIAVRSKLQLFGKFVGTWTFEGTEYHNDGSHPTDKGEIPFRWVLNGSAVQDVFLENSRSDNRAQLDGTSIRFYDPKIDAWRVTWINPETGVVRALISRKSGEDIVMEVSQSDGPPFPLDLGDTMERWFRFR